MSLNPQASPGGNFTDELHTTVDSTVTIFTCVSLHFLM
jgi:hypothetical protein